MSITITFNTILEKQPKHGDSVIYLNPIGQFGYEGFEPRECTVEYSWEELDEHGEPTGNSACYNPGEYSEDYKRGDVCEDNYKLAIMLNEYIADDNVLWISVDDYWECFE